MGRLGRKRTSCGTDSLKYALIRKNRKTGWNNKHDECRLVKWYSGKKTLWKRSAFYRLHNGSHAALHQHKNCSANQPQKDNARLDD